MTIRGGGNPHSAMAAMPLREWTRRLGALPAEAYDCFMVGTPYGFNRIQAWFARLIAANGRLPSDHRAADPDPAACRRARVRQGQAFGGAEEAPSLTPLRATAMEICGRDGRMLAARVEQKNGMTKGRQKWRDAPLTKKAPYKPHTSRMREIGTSGSMSGMGNGALPNGPSYRAHPRLYR